MSEFTDKPIFDPTLFVTIRKRLGTNDFDDMSVSLLNIQVEKSRTAAEEKSNNNDDLNTDSTPAQRSIPVLQIAKGDCTKARTCADAEVRYPTDIDFLHDGCKAIARYIDKLCKHFSLVAPVIPLQGCPFCLSGSNQAQKAE